MVPLRAALMLLASVLLHAGADFDPLRDVHLTVTRRVLSVVVPQGVHLKASLFRAALVSRGTLQLGELPPRTDRDEAGDPIWRGTVRMGLKGSGLEDPVRLVITFQPCTEGVDGRCFLPVKRNLTVPLADLLGEGP